MDTTLLFIGKATLLLTAALLIVKALSGVNPRWRVLSCEITAIAILLLPAFGALSLFAIDIPLPARATTLAVDVPSTLQPDGAPAIARQPSAAESDHSVATNIAAMSPFPWSTIAMAIYMMGLLGFVTCYGLSRRKLRLALDQLPNADTESQQALDAALASCSLRTRPRLLTDNTRWAPFCCKHRGGTIVIPAKATADELGIVLHHELQHLANRDLSRMAFMNAFVAILWFHPMAWLLRRAHADAAEETSDRAAAAQIGQERYRSQLAELALQCASTPAIPAGGLGLFRTAQIVKRLRRLNLSRAHTPLGTGGIALAIGVTMIGAMVLAGVQFAEAHWLGDEKSKRTDAIPFAAKVPKAQRAAAERAIAKAFSKVLTFQHTDTGAIALPAEATPNYQVATSSLAATALLAYGGADPRSPYHSAMSDALGFVLHSQRESGMFFPSPDAERAGVFYQHLIGTWCVASLLPHVADADRPQIERRLKLAVQIILDAQAVKKPEATRGGWRYTPESRDSDLSCTAWGVRALVAARRAGIDVPEKAFADALTFVRRTQHESGGFAYTPNGSATVSCTSMGLYCLVALDEPDTPRVERSVSYLLKSLPEDPKQLPPAKQSHYHFYGLHWAASAMSGVDQKTADRYAAWLYPHAIASPKRWTLARGSLLGIY